VTAKVVVLVVYPVSHTSIYVLVYVVVTMDLEIGYDALGVGNGCSGVKDGRFG
jgi:hypothetical protein